MIKIMSLIFAIILWSYVKGEANFITSANYKNIEVSYEGLSDLKANNLTIISPKESTVDVKLQGYNSYMRNVTRDGIVAKVDVSKLTEGEHSVPINVSYIDLGISVTNTTPRRIPFKIDKVVEETKPINFYNYKNGNDLVNLSLPDNVTLVDESIDFRLKSIANED